MGDLSFDTGALIALGLVAALGLPILRRLLAFESLLGERVGPLRLEPVAADAWPDYERDYLTAGVAPFEALGFGPLRPFRVHETGPDTWRGAGLAQRGPVLLIVTRAASPRLTGGHTVQLVSFTPEGRGVLTAPGLAALMPGVPPGVSMTEVLDDAPEAVLQAHLQAMEAQPGPWVEDFDALVAQLGAAEGALQEELRRTGLTEPDPARPGLDRLTLRGAGRWTRRLLAAKGPRRPEPPLPPEVAADLFEDVARNRAAPRRRDFTLGLLGLTGALFAGGIALVWSPAAAAVVTGAVLLHELGHLVAMRALGAKNTSVFFIPFLGAATTGQRDTGTLGQEVLILLAGPLPGLALAALLAVVSPPGLHSEVGRLGIAVLIGLNLFNLLPFFPLDGGKVVHLVLFGRRPYADGIARLLATTLLAVVGLVAGDPILAFVGGLGLLGVRTAFELARAEADLRAEGIGPDTPTHARITAIFRRLQARAPRRFSGQLVRARVLAPRLATPLHAPAARWAGGLAYAAAIATGVGALAAYALGGRTGAGVEGPRDVVAVRVLPCEGPLSPPADLRGPHALDVTCETEAPKDVLRTLTPYSMASLLLCAPEPWEASVRQQHAIASIGRAQAVHYGLLVEGREPSVQTVLRALDGDAVDLAVARTYLELTRDVDAAEHEARLQDLRRRAGFPPSCPRTETGSPPGLAVFDATDAVEISVWRAPEGAALGRLRDYMCQLGCRSLEAAWWRAPEAEPLP